MLKRVLLPAALVLSLAATGLAEKKRITLKNGRVFVGDVVERTDKGIKVKGKLAVVFYPKAQIESIEDIRDPQSDFAERLAKIDKTSADAHVKLGRWAMDRKLHKQAVACFQGALKIKKDDERAKLLLRQAQAKLKDSASSGTGFASFFPSLWSRSGRLSRISLSRSGVHVRFTPLRPAITILSTCCLSIPPRVSAHWWNPAKRGRR